MMDVHYFEQLNQTLKDYKRAIPCLLIDLDILDKNLQLLKNTLAGKKDFRIVVKSLPCVELIDYVMKAMKTNRLMVFHQPFLSHLSEYVTNEVDILTGKPMPVKTAAYFYENLSSNFNPSKQLQWLIDDIERLKHYLQLATSIQQKMKVNLEIDVGLHRGGFRNLAQLTQAFQIIDSNKQYLEFSGLMGYDPHIPKLPNWLISRKKAFHKANQFYTNCIELVKNQFPNLWKSDLTFNGAGSPTLHLHNNYQSVLNEVSAGSCLLKPTTFDVLALKDYQPACFIATPVLKKLNSTTLPGIEKLNRFFNLINSKYRHSYFIYGGFWKADYCYPPGIEENSIFGPSTNQVMLNALPIKHLEVDDFVFLRPHQSEFVLLQFGNILTLRTGKIVDEWKLLRNY